MNKNRCIPKLIHYCWFGNKPLNTLAKKCIKSWHKHCPDYKVIEWNESNFDINCNDYVKEAYEAKKWAFVSDYVRLWVLVKYGGIYMDTDCELIKPIDRFLELKAVSGFESESRVQTAFMGCVKNNEIFVDFLNDYDNRHFRLTDGSLDLTTNVTSITRICLKYGLVLNGKKQTIHGFTLYPTEYFCPLDYETKVLSITKNTHAIHHFSGSWISLPVKVNSFLMFKITTFLKKYEYLYCIIRIFKHIRNKQFRKIILSYERDKV